jgi:hypothetical protein
VAGATVYGTFTGPTSGSTGGVTDEYGMATLVLPSKKDGGTRDFCVDNVELSGWTYDPDANVETCDSVTWQG